MPAPESSWARDGQTPIKRNVSTLRQLNRLYDRQSPEFAFRAETLEEMEAWRQRLRARLRSLLGLDRLGKEGIVPAQAEVVERVQEDAFVGEKVLVQTQGDMWVPAWVLIPSGGKPPYPALLCLHGHGMSKDVTAGRPRTKEERAALQRYNGDYGKQFAERGYLCFCPDTRGFGERRGNSDLGDCDHLYRNAIMVGQVLTGLRIWDHLRSLEYLLKRPDVDRERIGVIGLSMGEEHAMYIAALDERVGAAVLSCGMRDLRKEVRDKVHCICSYVPGLFTVADWPDICALIAPRPVLIEQGRYDYVPMNLVRSGEARMRRAYELLGAPECIDTDYFEGGHQFSGRKAFAWMDHWLKRVRQ